MAWVTRGKDSDGLLQEGSDGQSICTPALATHHGELWCLWVSRDGTVFYARGDNDVFQPRIEFPDRGIPTVAELHGMLHAVIVRESGVIAHYLFNDAEEIWEVVSQLDQEAGFGSKTYAALTSFHNKLCLVFIRDYLLMYSFWDLRSAVWSEPLMVSSYTVLGEPALFVLNETLHLLCGSGDSTREILGFRFESSSNIWVEADDVTEGKAALGVSAASYGPTAYLGFQENGPDDESHSIHVSEYINGEWHPQSPVAKQSSADPPQLAVLNGRINCIFNSNDEEKTLKWYSRPILDFSLSSWMSGLSNDALLSSLTIPGTHDSCARSNIPFVRTQYLSIGKQLEAGLRFLDLRCRVHDDGKLYLYHGGIAINWPRHLSLQSIMDEVFTVLDKSSPATETVLISINNDDTKTLDHSQFYAAVKSQIAASAGPTGETRWIDGQSTPTLGEARGKAVLLRRFQADPTIETSELIGIDLSSWPNNSVEFTVKTESGVNVTIEDRWMYAEVVELDELIRDKLGHITNLLTKAVAGPPNDWYISFSSAVGDPVEHGEVAESKWIAVGSHSDFIGKYVPGINSHLRNFPWKSTTRYGVIPMDYPELPKDSDLVARLIASNM